MSSIACQLYLSSIAFKNGRGRALLMARPGCPCPAVPDQKGPLWSTSPVDTVFLPFPVGCHLTRLLPAHRADLTRQALIPRLPTGVSFRAWVFVHITSSQYIHRPRAISWGPGVPCVSAETPGSCSKSNSNILRSYRPRFWKLRIPGVPPVLSPSHCSFSVDFRLWQPEEGKSPS